jgi:hypothetical protein
LGASSGATYLRVSMNWDVLNNKVNMSK